jgi:aryl-alcohol dehydrogenase-like predicted oxidoreductase
MRVRSSRGGRGADLAVAPGGLPAEGLPDDPVDLLQFHEIIRMGDADRIFATGGTLEAGLDAKKAGKLRYIGFTGHKDPKIHLHMLETAASQGFDFDTVQMPLNVMDTHFKRCCRWCCRRGSARWG